jgi:hypothetical protein
MANEKQKLRGWVPNKLTPARYVRLDPAVRAAARWRAGRDLRERLAAATTLLISAIVVVVIGLVLLRACAGH